jgi:UDP-glucose 4-epimerase
MRVLVTGGAGYIGSHAVKRLLAAGHVPIVLDNLDRGNLRALELLGEHAGSPIEFVEGDVADSELVLETLKTHRIQALMHFAALAYVRESVNEPVRYFKNNTAGSITLLEACLEAGVSRFVFSSTCATYGEPDASMIPITEECPQLPINPYGWSKLFFERVLIDAQDNLLHEGTPFAFAALRYFNVAGSDRECVIGEDHDPETHIIPIALEVAQGNREQLTIFGTDLATPDGTCVRDYIHVEDLVEAHVRVLDALDPHDDDKQRMIYNLGNGEGFSVLQIAKSVQRVTGVPIELLDGPANHADPPVLTACADKIERELGFKPTITDLDEIVRSSWNWMQQNPDGYSS